MALSAPKRDRVAACEVGPFELETVGVGGRVMVLLAMASEVGVELAAVEAMLGLLMSCRRTSEL